MILLTAVFLQNFSKQLSDQKEIGYYLHYTTYLRNYWWSFQHFTSYRFSQKTQLASELHIKGNKVKMLLKNTDRKFELGF